MKILYHIIVKCRKCEAERKIIIPDTYSVADTLRKLSFLEQAECPTCGEEPYDNWCFVGVRKAI